MHPCAGLGNEVRLGQILPRFFTRRVPRISRPRKKIGTGKGSQPTGWQWLIFSKSQTEMTKENARLRIPRLSRSAQGTTLPRAYPRTPRYLPPRLTRWPARAAPRRPTPSTTRRTRASSSRTPAPRVKDAPGPCARNALARRRPEGSTRLITTTAWRWRGASDKGSRSTRRTPSRWSRRPRFRTTEPRTSPSPRWKNEKRKTRRSSRRRVTTCLRDIAARFRRAKPRARPRSRPWCPARSRPGPPRRSRPPPPRASRAPSPRP